MAKGLYRTARWQRVRRMKLRINPLCEYCPPGEVKRATQVDHIKPIKDGGAPFDLKNLASACASCHSRKTIYLDGGAGRPRGNRVPVKGCDASGNPRDPEHWWNK